MRFGSTLRVLCLAVAMAGTACAVPKDAGFADVRKAVEARTGHTIYWDQNGAADAEVKRTVRAMLGHDLAVAEAVQIALLDNRALRARYEELAIAEADLVQAGLLKNPVFAGFFHLPVSGPGVAHGEIGVEQDFLDVFMLPARKRLAAAELEAAKLHVGSAVLDLAYDVRIAYFTLQGAQQIAAMRRVVLEAADASKDVAERQFEAGNLGDLDLANERALREQVRTDLARSEVEVIGARERLTRLMGVTGVETSFHVAAMLPSLPAREPSLENLESFAMATRLDVAAARQELAVSSLALSTAKDFRWIGGLSAGVNVERESDRTRAIGPAGQIELPLFDQHQAQVARLEAEVRRADDRMQALAGDARSEVREIAARVVFARDLVVHYRDIVVPLRERVVALSQVHYDAMLLGVYQLLAAKQAEVTAYREYIEATRDYWVARAELGRAVGGRLPNPQ
jgi:outer membrane protein, heavy metal efflux system